MWTCNGSVYYFHLRSKQKNQLSYRLLRNVTFVQLVALKKLFNPCFLIYSCLHP